MCGRYAQSADMRELIEQFEVSGSSPAHSLPANWNIAATNPIYILRVDSDDHQKNALAVVSWGLIAPWLRDLNEAKASQSRAINARSESIHQKPTFQEAFKSRRCIIPAQGYYEWATALGRFAPKQPFYISAKNGGQLPIAGIWSSWSAPGGALIQSASIITQEAQGDLAEIHSRMPVFMPHDRWSQWLNPENREVENLRALMVVDSPASIVIAHPVSSTVNSVNNNSQELTARIELGEPETLF
ncbi:MAG: SOS response-associated peptidase [Actinomycetota bacterium]|nr:SOS response-associated peptidase [Actinomycetota bacterium]